MLSEYSHNANDRITEAFLSHQTIVRIDMKCGMSYNYRHSRVIAKLCEAAANHNISQVNNAMEVYMNDPVLQCKFQ